MFYGTTTKTTNPPPPPPTPPKMHYKSTTLSYVADTFYIQEDEWQPMLSVHDSDISDHFQLHRLCKEHLYIFYHHSLKLKQSYNVCVCTYVFVYFCICMLTKAFFSSQAEEWLLLPSLLLLEAASPSSFSWAVPAVAVLPSSKFGKGTIHDLRLRDSQDSETPKTPRLQDSISIHIWHPFLFSLYCYVFEGNEIHISDFFVGMNYSI